MFAVGSGQLLLRSKIFNNGVFKFDSVKSKTLNDRSKIEDTLLAEIEIKNDQSLVRDFGEVGRDTSHSHKGEDKISTS